VGEKGWGESGFRFERLFESSWGTQKTGGLCGRPSFRALTLKILYHHALLEGSFEWNQHFSPSSSDAPLPSEQEYSLLFKVQSKQIKANPTMTMNTPNTPTSPIEIAARFAQTLDHEDYPAATALLSDSCVYQIRGNTHKAPEAIIATYQSNGDQATQNFDSITYGSSIRPSNDDRIIIEFWDQITHRGRTHKHQCEQWVRVESGLITEIEHRDLPGEVEALKEFKEWCAE
jgi:hypothetical protein